MTGREETTMNDKEVLRAVMDRFSHKIREDQRLGILSGVVKLYFGEDILFGVGPFMSSNDGNPVEPTDLSEP
jgi:hypothetical protein